MFNCSQELYEYRANHFYYNYCIKYTYRYKALFKQIRVHCRPPNIKKNKFCKIQLKTRVYVIGLESIACNLLFSSIWSLKFCKSRTISYEAWSLEENLRLLQHVIWSAQLFFVVKWIVLSDRIMSIWQICFVLTLLLTLPLTLNTTSRCVFILKLIIGIVSIMNWVFYILAF